MNTVKLMLLAIALIFVAACNSHKKNAITTVTSTPVTTPTTSITASVNTAPAKPANGVYAPGEAELTAIKVQYNDISLNKLMEGYSIYTEGACIKCHGAKNIYKRGVEQWKGIIDDMAEKARISDAQKDAVYKYVLAIKATQGQ